MKPYIAQGKSGIESYETGEDYIIIRFRKASYDYKFTYASAGKVAVEVMKKMAEQGSGLSTYVATQMKDKHESKKPVSGADRTNFMNINFE